MKCARMRGLVFACLAVGAFSASALADGLLLDDFNDNTINPAWWNAQTLAGPTVQEVNSRVEVFVPGGSSASFFAAGLQSAYRLTGDFDVQVDYALLSWPQHNGVRVGLTVSPVTGSGGGVERVSRQSGEYDGAEDYCTDFGGQGLWTVTGDTSGTLRLQRTGGTISGYYLNGGNWSLVSSAAISASDVNVSISGWSDPSIFGHQDVRFAFDNFRINSGHFAPEPATVSLLLLGGLAMIRRRRRA